MTTADTTPRLLITAGPTYEPIDAVRFIGNRSSGRLGSALADHAARAGWQVTLLLGPNAVRPEDKGVEVVRFQSCRDLELLLQDHLPRCDTLVMAAAVADYRPVPEEIDLDGKRKRKPGEMTIRLEGTPDLLAGCSKNAREDQLLVGFALEPRDRLIESAQGKLQRKNIDLIVANPLETMDADSIEAMLIGNPARGLRLTIETPGIITKTDFANWLIEQITPLCQQRRTLCAGNSTHA
ncbi:MAG: phosphopantothenoylcysteine decarboxylase [Phycisphaerales bacterium]|nr:phosphopantothenoylcysteine decarboxylase [Phycisphaerales bacterium]